jgi:hypothetical protein
MLCSTLGSAQGEPALRPTLWQASAVLYLTLPVVLFLLFFSSYALAATGICFVGWALWQLLREGVERSVSRPIAGALLLIACLFIASSGMLPPLWQNGDYGKHYTILYALMDHHWPVVIDVGNGPEMLRYYLGWYLVPTGLSKFIGHKTIDYTMACWSALGLWLVFLLLAEALQVESKSRWWALLAVLMFMFFSGMDHLGVALTGHLLGYPDMFEWWAIWYQFSSIMTSLVWSPQHGLATWLGVGLLLNARPGSKIMTHIGLIFLAVLFWSPLCAVGIVPFVLVAAGAKGFRGLLSVSNFVSLVALAPPLVGYLTADSARFPHVWMFNVPSWNVENIVCFWLLEFGIFALLVGAIGTTRKTMFGVAVATLLLIPLFSMGAMNDFAMRASTAPIAVLAYIGIEIILSKPWRRTLPLVVVFALGLGTPFAEISRGYRWASRGGRGLAMGLDMTNSFRTQYVAPYPNRFLRSVSP